MNAQAIETKAISMIKAQTTEQLKVVWDTTTKNIHAIRKAGNVVSCEEFYMVRGWIIEVLRDRLTDEQFDLFMGYSI